MPTTELERPAEVSTPLTHCDQEPIHLFGSIQPIGFLVQVSPEWIILRVSENAGAFLGKPVKDLIGAPLSHSVGAAAMHTIRNRLATLGAADTVERAFGVRLGKAGQLVDLSLYRCGPTLVLEGEASEAQGDLTAGVLVRSMIARLEQATSFNELTAEASRQVRALTGFDRVMVYRFHPDGSGEVIAESLRGRLETYLGLRYPATDIPRQARALFQRNVLRLIADVDAVPIPIVPRLDAAGEPIDLSLSGLRTVSPLHLQYLRNMGVQSSMSISIVRRGKLWGMIACHHMAGRHIGFERRTAAELFVQMFALLLESRERQEEVDYEVRARLIHNQVLATIVAGASTADSIASLADKMTELAPCDGVGLWVGGEATMKGDTPTSAEFESLVGYLASRGDGQIYANAEIGGDYEPARLWAPRAVGVLAVPISRAPGDYLVFFRRELAHTVTWAGRPEKPVEVAGDDGRLTPRKSFEAWRQIVRGQSAPWTEAEQRAAEALRITLLDVILRLTQVADSERRSIAGKQDLLIGELNHRVRNILGLVNGLVSQGKASADDIGAFSAVLGGRVQALARAHNQITADNWGPASLGSLIATEAAPFDDARMNAVVADGPPVLLQPQAFTTLALVIHELMTNSVKYGALSAMDGQVAVGWIVEGSGNLVISWNEAGGPPVRPPTRRGFGSMIIERSIPHELQGEATVEYPSAGLRARFTVPGSYIVPGVPEARNVDERAITPVSARLSGVVLLVEDSMVISLDAEQMLLALGAERVDVASSIADAMRLLDLETPSFAVVDVNLGADTSFVVANRLQVLGIPFIFATGYGDEVAFPVGLKDVPIVRKPYTAQAIARVAKF